MDLVDALLAATAALREADVAHGVCGGIAVTLRGATRSTGDIDLLVPPAEVPAAMDALRPLGWTYAALPMTFGAGTSLERRVQRVSRLEGKAVISIHLIEAVGPLAEVWASRIVMELPSGAVPVVSFDGLAHMKRLAGRPQDLADLDRLELLDG